MSVATAPKPDVLRAADASRVAAIRNSLDLNDAEAVVLFGERARREVTASTERLLAEVRGRDVAESAEILKRAAKTIDALDASTLEARGLFASHAGRLKKFRAGFEEAAAMIEGLEGDLKERAERLSHKVKALNALHDQAKTFILELDAYLDAGRAGLTEAAKALATPAPGAEGVAVAEVAPARDPERVGRLSRRLTELD
ncbi:toxic anion resistance protein, partial [Caulobacter sp. 17J65-9]|uniref:toxic anion resistance protein n=1 Tax=Caulobacter sp. 17J65-9 TaxID=2709382 RepID=UPI0013C9869C